MITVVGNLKGGSGKSTLAFNLGVWLAARNVKVALFDLDPQRTLSDVVEVRTEEGYEPAMIVQNAGRDLPKRMRTAAEGEVLVDVGTADMKALKTALTLADRILIPVPPSQADLWSTQRFLAQIGEAVGDKPPQICVFVNRADTHVAIRESDETEEALKGLPNVTLLPQRLCQRTAFRRSFSEGLGVFELEPSGKAAKELAGLAEWLYPDYTS